MFVQNDWKATKALTLNLGLRYGLFTQPVDARDLGSLFDVTTGQYALPGQNDYIRAIVDGDHNNFGPRVGFAWQALSLNWLCAGATARWLSHGDVFFLPAASSPTLTCIGSPGSACNANNPAFGKLSSGTATGRQIQSGLKLYF